MNNQDQIIHHYSVEFGDWVLFNSHETGTTCSSICYEKIEKFLFILLAIGLTI